MKKVCAVMVLLAVTVSFGVYPQKIFAQDTSEQSVDKQVKDAVQKYILEKIKFSGTFDLYDDSIKAARNLRKIKIYDEIKEDNGVYVAIVDFRDVKKGSVLTTKMTLSKKGEAFSVDDVAIEKITEIKKEADKEYSDEEVQQAMRDFVENQKKYTGSVMLYDEERSVMRQLELMDLDKEVRKMGFYRISRAKFKDLESGQTVHVDITVKKNKIGELEVTALRIRKVTK